MPQLIANFQDDWLLHLRDEMINDLGWMIDDLSALNACDIGYRYFDALRRKITNTPREVIFANDFVCPEECHLGWVALQAKIKNGLNINPHLSKNHASLQNNDGLLAEWGVHHFHLGTSTDRKDQNYIQRTSQILFAFITDDCFYAIDVYSHQDFTNVDVLKRIHENWPKLIEKYRAEKVTGASLEPEERKNLRKNNGNVATAMPDGTVYMPISGGVTASGMNFEAIWHADYWLIKMDEFQKKVESMLDQIIPTLNHNGYIAEPNIEAKLQFPKTIFGSLKSELWVYFPTYKAHLIFYDSKYPFDIKWILIHKTKNFMADDSTPIPAIKTLPGQR